MYESYYGLREKPFSILPDPELIYWGANHRMAFAMLEFGVMNSAGFTVITGEIGSGKTTLVRRLLRTLDPNINVGLVSNTPHGREELLQSVMMSLNQPFDEKYSQLLFKFEKHLRAQHSKNRRTLLIVDEAQNLQPDALETLRMLSNVNADKEQLLQLILVGQPQLRKLLCSSELIQFAQRISSDFHLKSLTSAEVTQYITYRLMAAGARSQLFTQEACAKIAHTSAGIPRTINILCDTALVYGYASKSNVVTKGLVDRVINDKRSYGIFSQ
jgi:general secretion pathway protein A